MAVDEYDQRFMRKARADLERVQEALRRASVQLERCRQSLDKAREASESVVVPRLEGQLKK